MADKVDIHQIKTKDDPIDYAHRHLVNLIALVALLIIAIAIVWTVKAMEDNENLNRCVATGRRDCSPLSIAQPVRSVVIINH
jgi:hypothetical protein